MFRFASTRFAIASIFLAVSGTHAQNRVTVVIPPVSVLATEIAQVSIMSGASDYTGLVFTNPCQVVVTFYGADGNALSTSPVLTVGKLPQIVSAQLPYALTAATGASAFVSAQIVSTQGDSAYDGPAFAPPCASVFSLSTYDAATGVTHAFTSGQTGFGVEVGSVQPLPCTYTLSIECGSPFAGVPAQVITLPPVNLAASETAQVAIAGSTYGYGPLPSVCGASTITFQNTDGTAIGTPTTFTAGQTQQVFSAQLPYAGTGATALNAAISAQIAINAFPSSVVYSGAVPPCAIAFSMKTFDTATCATHVFLAGQSMPPFLLNTTTASGVPTAPEHHSPPRNHALDK